MTAPATDPAKARSRQDSLEALDTQGFSGWAQALLLLDDSACEALLSLAEPDWTAQAGSGLIELSAAHARIRLDTPLFAQRALAAKKSTQKQFQAACSMWMSAQSFNASCAASGAPPAPTLALLALARLSSHPRGAPFKAALRSPRGAEALNPAVFPMLPFALLNGVPAQWFDPLFEISASWSVPRPMRDQFRGATHLAHLAVDALARAQNSAPLAWCVSRGSTLEAKDVQGRGCVERALDIAVHPTARLLTARFLAELGAPFEPRQLASLDTACREAVEPILLARSERLALGAQIALSAPAKPAQAEPAAPVKRKRL